MHSLPSTKLRIRKVKQLTEVPPPGNGWIGSRAWNVDPGAAGSA